MQSLSCLLTFIFLVLIPFHVVNCKFVSRTFGHHNSVFFVRLYFKSVCEPNTLCITHFSIAIKSTTCLKDSSSKKF